MARLTKISFHVMDLDSLHVDKSGMPYYICTFTNTTAGTVKNTEPLIPMQGLLAYVSITNPPIRHSKPGATRVLYLDFSGHVVTNTEWNLEYDVPRWDCLPFDTDGDTNTFSDLEQTYIIRMWERVAEDYAPFNVDVTTERPAAWTSTTGHALITPDVDANGTNCPHYGAGGIAFVDVFSQSDYSYNSASCYSPAFILPMSGNGYADTAEAASHELGHNMGLSHDGFLVPPTTNAYYEGHGSGDISWGAIMGAAYDCNVSQWSKGEYYGANNFEDDLAIISAKAPYRADDHGGTNSTATMLTAINGTNIIASGIISSNTDVDVLAFATGAGAISVTVFPYRCASGTYGGNLDVYARLYNSVGTLVASDNPTDTTSAVINYTAPVGGTYYLHISGSGTGNPTNNPPTGYTSYGSIGQYFVTGRVVQASGLLVQAPNGGEVWYKGQTNSVTWISGTNASGNVKIDLYRGASLAGVITNSVTNSGTYSWTITNTLIYATNYQIRVSSVTQTSVWDQSDSSFTIATPPSRLLFQNFDAAPSLPSGWSQTNLHGTTSWAFQTGGQHSNAHPDIAHSGSYNACLYAVNYVTNICRLATPVINMTGYTSAVLKFWHYMELWDFDQDYLNVRVKTNSTAPWMFIAGYSNSIDSWTQQSITLPNASSNYTIAFEGIAKYGYGVCLDDVEVIGSPVEVTVATNNTPLWWLADYGLPTTDDGALSDTDGDGMKAWAEWIAGTSPTQYSSALRITNTWLAASNHIVRWSIVAGRVYSVSWSSNLATKAFNAMVTNNTAGIYTDTLHSADQADFYRIGVQMSP